jgi:hypothetical protein
MCQMHEITYHTTLPMHLLLLRPWLTSHVARLVGDRTKHWTNHTYAWPIIVIYTQLYWSHIIYGNISSGNQSLRANYGNFNLNHTILIQGRTHERWEGWFAKFMGGGRDDLQRCFCKSLLPPPLSAPLDQHHVTQIEVSIVFTERLVSTWYVAIIYWQSTSKIQYEKCKITLLFVCRTP